MADETTTRAPSNPIDFSAPVTSGGAAAAAAVCVKCAAPITGYYYENAGAVYCPKCKRLAEEASGGASDTRSGGSMTRATLLGLGAAIVGAVGYWAFIKITDFEWALVSIAVGILVAKAIRKGNGDRGGRRYQILAVALTYLAIGGAYVPFALEGASEASSKQHATTSSTTAAAPDKGENAVADEVATAQRAATSAASAASAVASDAGSVAAPHAESSAPSRAESAKPKQISLAKAIPLFLGAVVVLALVGPVLIIFGGMPGSIINIAIIGFALRRAWLMTAAGAGVTAPAFSGPYNVKSRPASVGAPAAGA